MWSGRIYGEGDTTNISDGRFFLLQSFLSEHAVWPVECLQQFPFSFQITVLHLFFNLSNYHVIFQFDVLRRLQYILF